MLIATCGLLLVPLSSNYAPHRTRARTQRLFDCRTARAGERGRGANSRQASLNFT
jgi:hypothetical protein